MFGLGKKKKEKINNLELKVESLDWSLNIMIDRLENALDEIDVLRDEVFELRHTKAKVEVILPNMFKLRNTVTGKIVSVMYDSLEEKYDILGHGLYTSSEVLEEYLQSEWEMV